MDDLVQLGVVVDVPVAILLGMDQISVDGHLKEAGGARGSLARHFELALAELVYESGLELVELGLVPSGAAVNHVDFYHLQTVFGESYSARELID